MFQQLFKIFTHKAINVFLVFALYLTIYISIIYIQYNNNFSFKL